MGGYMNDEAEMKKFDRHVSLQKHIINYFEGDIITCDDANVLVPACLSLVMQVCIQDGMSVMDFMEKALKTWPLAQELVDSKNTTLTRKDK